MITNAVILAGGAGTRLWPASNRKHPKQFIALADGTTLLQRTVLRALGTGAKRVVIVTHQDQAEQVVEDIRRVATAAGRVAVLAEPSARNTAPAIALALAYLERPAEAGAVDGAVPAAGDDTVLVMPADHVIEPVSSFYSDVELAETLAGSGKIVTFGITPTSPETGYGYIEIGDPSPPGYLVATFREKPDLQTAERYMRSGHHFWNSGMFVFRASTMQDELARHSPGIATAFEGVRGRVATRPLDGANAGWIMAPSAAVDEAYERTDAISIDYAVMERSASSAMVAGTFEWNDIGSWDQFAALPKASASQDDSSRVVAVDSDGCFVYSDLPVALCGVTDLHVIVKNGVVLVCRKGASQNVKDIVGRLRDADREDLL